MAPSAEAFVPGYRHDVFVSYAHDDDREMLEGVGESRWVTTLVSKLVNNFLRGRLRAVNPERIWIDHRLQGNERVAPALEEAISGSATLLVILSQAYLDSPWCRTERELFLNGFALEHEFEGRVFVVQREEIERSRWPKEFQGLRGYEFFRKDDTFGTKSGPMAIPTPSPTEKDYFLRLADLAGDLADRLKHMRDNALAGEPPETTRAVFLAEAYGSTVDAREAVQRALKDAGIRVFPENYYPRTPTEFEKAMQRDLESCQLFVQMLGSGPFPKTIDLPKGYDGLQLRVAQQTGIPILRWHDEQLDLGQVRDAAHADDLRSADVTASSVVRLGDDIVRTLEQIESQPAPPYKIGEGPTVLLCAHEKDAAVLDQVIKAIEPRERFGYEADEPLENYHEFPPFFHGLMLIYGRCEAIWVKRQIRWCRTLFSRSKTRPHVCALFKPPPLDKEPVRTRLPGMKEIIAADVNEAVLSDFLDEVEQRYFHG